MKYIVKNCPCYWHIGGDDGCDLDNMKACEDDNNCIIKQIVELCKKEKEPICTIDDDNGTSTTYFKNDIYLANKILEALEIEEE